LVPERDVTTWVLLRGWTREARHWGEFPAMLRSRLPAGDRVVAPDLPGCGTRRAERSPARVEGMVDAVRDELLRMGHPAPYVLVALSLGGMVAIDWASRDPSGLRACVLINTSLGGLAPFWQRMRPASMVRVAALLLARDLRSRERGILALTSQARSNDLALAGRWAEYAADSPASVGTAMRQLAAAALFRAPPKRPSLPLLLLASSGDRLVSPACSRTLARHWRVALAEHPTAGHDLPLDAPEWVADAISRWWTLGA
jgi:pimeloyl-ACP methyl ester carboxylesterase